jgi:hypothetical protein
VIKRVLILILKRVYQVEIISQVRYQFEILFEKLKFYKLVVVRSFCFGLILSPPLAWIAKNGIIRALWITFSLFGHKQMSKDYTKDGDLLLWTRVLSPKGWRFARSDGEGWVTEWKPLFSPKTPIPFQYTYDLVWSRLENTLVIAYERDMIKRYIN